MSMNFPNTDDRPARRRRGLELRLAPWQEAERAIVKTHGAKWNGTNKVWTFPNTDAIAAARIEIAEMEETLDEQTIAQRERGKAEAAKRQSDWLERAESEPATAKQIALIARFVAKDTSPEAAAIDLSSLNAKEAFELITGYLNPKDKETK